MVVTGYTWGVLGRLKNEEGYPPHTLSVPFHPLRPPLVRGGRLLLVYSIV